MYNIYGQITITSEVAAEFGEKLPDWIKVVSIKDTDKTKLISSILDPGEASAIVLALEKADSLLILDDGRARNFAKSLGIKLTGTLGILLKAYKTKIIPNLQDTISELRQNGFYISKDIEAELLKLL